MLGEHKVLIALIVMVFGTISIIAINQPSQHERRMELIEEKEALFQLQLKTHVEIEKTQRFIDSLETEIDSTLN